MKITLCNSSQPINCVVLNFMEVTKLRNWTNQIDKWMNEWMSKKLSLRIIVQYFKEIEKSKYKVIDQSSIWKNEWKNGWVCENYWMNEWVTCKINTNTTPHLIHSLEKSYLKQTLILTLMSQYLAQSLAVISCIT